MSETMSSSVDDFIEITDEDAINDEELESESNSKKVFAQIDSRRRLEDRLAERRLEKDIREFDFDF
jgi:hypothetical protein